MSSGTGFGRSPKNQGPFLIVKNQSKIRSALSKVTDQHLILLRHQGGPGQDQDATQDGESTHRFPEPEPFTNNRDMDLQSNDHRGEKRADPLDRFEVKDADHTANHPEQSELPRLRPGGHGPTVEHGDDDRAQKQRDDGQELDLRQVALPCREIGISDRRSPVLLPRER